MSGEVLAARFRRTGDLLHRRLLLWGDRRAGYLAPRAETSRGAPSAVLVLQAGPNPTVDYFLRPRLKASGARLKWDIVNLETSPEAALPAGQEGVHVIVCRYINSAWMKALERRAAQLHGVTYVVDDDLPAMVLDPAIPPSARGRILMDYERHRRRLEDLVSEIWTTSDTLADLMSGRTVRVLDPCPTEEPPLWTDPPPPLVVYHGGATHQAERSFVYEVAGLLERKRPDIRFEVADTNAGRRPSRPNVTSAPYTDWETYLRSQTGRHAAVMLAPLFDTPVNRARAPVKFLDAARLGAVGVYALAPAYREFVRPEADGIVIPMAPPQWAAAIERLIDQEPLRRRLAENARNRVRALHDSTTALDFAEGAC